MIIFTGEVLPKVSNYDKAGCFIIIIFGGEVVSKIYNLELNDRNVSTLTRNDKLNKADNNTGMCQGKKRRYSDFIK